MDLKPLKIEVFNLFFDHAIALSLPESLTKRQDRVARDYITSAGYGDHFGHGLGHGVGLAVHEKPGFGKSNSMELEENMVVTIEPGIYLPSWGGVRLENMVRVTADGCEVLNENEFFYSF